MQFARNIPTIFILAALVLGTTTTSALAVPAPLHAYELNGTLADSGTGNLPIESEGGVLTNDSVFGVYRFDPVLPTVENPDVDYNKGLTLHSPNLTNPATYSVEMRVKFDQIRNITDEPWVKLIDFNDGSNVSFEGDPGFYIEDFAGFNGNAEHPTGISSKIELFADNYGESASPVVFPNHWHHIVATRGTGASGNGFIAYVDGVQSLAPINDAGLTAVFDAAQNVMRFLQDDEESPDYDVYETTPGAVDYLRIYNEPLSASDIAQLATTSLTLLPGDYNKDGYVDSSDYGVWKSTYGKSYAVPGTGADGNADGVVDAADYVVGRKYLPAVVNVGASQSANVPEPAAAMLLVLGLLGIGTFAASRRPGRAVN